MEDGLGVLGVGKGRSVVGECRIGCVEDGARDEGAVFVVWFELWEDSRL